MKTKEERVAYAQEFTEMLKRIGEEPQTLDELLEEMCLEDWELTILKKALIENDLEVPYANNCYEHYDPSNRGCSMENPFMLSEKEDYVHLEYLIMDYLIEHDPCRIELMQMTEQYLMHENDRVYDMLKYEVRDFDGNVTFEEYWFDITDGFNSKTIK